jgi:SUKH-3 immunity protein
MSKPFTFDEDTKTVLRSAGWSELRSVSVDYWVTTLSEEGFTPSPCAIKVLRNLGGLMIKPPRDAQRVFLPDPISLDPVKAASGEFDRVEIWQEDYGLSLFPLAEVFLYAILLIEPQGRVFAGSASGFLLVGASIEAAMAVLTLARTRPTPYQQ